ncbi:MAG: hypothetical protein LPK02_07090 [Rhodobacterales bacterium]|nr:hypothetical protein [Rhodobacterales bacterium]
MQLTVRIDSAMAQKLYDMVVQEMDENQRDDPRCPYNQMVTDLKRAALSETFMRTGTVLHEDDHMILYEHPTKGDTAPMMAYHKASGRFYVSCGFWDCGNPEEILDALQQRAAEDLGV